MKWLSCVQLFATPWTVAYQAPPSLGFSRQEHWSGLPFPSPGDLPDPGIEPGSPALQADALPSEPPGNLYLLADYLIIACVPAKSLQSCPTLCNTMDCSPVGCSIHGFSRQEYWSGLLCPPPGDLPDPGLKPASLTSPELAGSLPLVPAGKPCHY